MKNYWLFDNYNVELLIASAGQFSTRLNLARTTVLTYESFSLVPVLAYMDV